MSRVLIAGCGDVGTRLGALLTEEGAQVFGLRRSEIARCGETGRDSARRGPSGSGNGTEVSSWIRADLTRPDTLRGLPADVDTVFYTAAAPSFDEDAYQATYVDGLRNLMDALESLPRPPARVVFVSSTAVYAQQAGEWVDEESAAVSEHFSGRTLLEAEQRVLGGATPGTVVRFGGIYGPGRTRLLDSVRAEKAALLAGAPRYVNLIHADDCARCLAHVAQLDSPDPLYLGVDHCPVDRNDLVTWLAGELGVGAPSLAASGPDAQSRVNPTRMMLSSKRCRSLNLRDSGFEFHYPTFRDGYAHLLP